MKYLEPRQFYDLALVSAPSEHSPAIYCEATLTAHLLENYQQIVKTEPRYAHSNKQTIRAKSLRLAHTWLRYLRSHYASVMIVQRCETCSSFITQTLQPCRESDIEACIPFLYKG